MSTPRKPFLPMTDAEVAAQCFVTGALMALTPARTAYEFEGIEGPGIGSYERAALCSGEIHRIDCADRLATLDRCIALAAQRHPFTQAAE